MIKNIECDSRMSRILRRDMHPTLKGLIIVFIVLLSAAFMPRVQALEEMKSTDITNITIPSSIPVSFDENGKSYIGSSNISNGNLVDLYLKGIEVVGQNGWDLQSWSESEKDGTSKFLSMKLNGQELNSMTVNNVNDFTIPQNSSRSMNLSVKDRLFKETVDSEVAFQFHLYFELEKRDFTLHLDNAGENDVGSIVAKNGDSVILPTPYKAGYTCEGWKDTSGTIYKTGSSYIMPIGDSTLIAQWRPNILTVRYHINGGTDVPEDKYFHDETELGYAKLVNYSYYEDGDIGGTGFFDMLPHRVKPPKGNTFSIYNTQPDGKGTDLDVNYHHKFVDLNKDILNNDCAIDIYAIWKPASYTIKFDGNGATSGSINDISATYGVPVTLPENGFKKIGYTFKSYVPYKEIDGKKLYLCRNQDKTDRWYEKDLIPDGFRLVEYVPGNDTARLQPEHKGIITFEAQWVVNKQNITFDDNYLKDNLYKNNYNVDLYKFCQATGNIKWFKDDKTTSGKAVEFSNIVPAFPKDTKNYGFYFTEFVPEIGKEYTLSFKIKANREINNVSLGSERDASNSFKYNKKITTEYVKHSYTFVASSNTYGMTIFYTDQNQKDYFRPEDKIYVTDLEIKEGLHQKDSIQKDYGSTIGTLPDLTRPGYTFKGWYDAPVGGNEITENTLIKGDKTYYAQWKINKVTFTYNMNGGGLANEHGANISASGDTLLLNNSKYIGELNYGETFTTGGLADWNNKSWINIEKFGYHCKEGAEWNTKPDGSGISYSDSVTYKASNFADLSNGNKNVVLYANWVPNSYVLTFNPNGGTVSPTSWNVDYGTAFGTLPTPSRTGYTFDGWYTALTGGTKVTSATTMGPGNMTIYARWIPNQYTYNINYVSSSGKSLGTSTVKGTYGSSVEVSAPAKNGYTTPAKQTVTFNSTSAKTIKFTYPIINYNITYTLNSGSVSGNPTSYNIESATITLKNPTRSGYTFTGWTGSNGTTAQTSVKIPAGSTGNKKYTANWKASVAQTPTVTAINTLKTNNDYGSWFYTSGSLGVNASVTDGGKLTYTWDMYWYTVGTPTSGGGPQPVKRKVTGFPSTMNKWNPYLYFSVDSWWQSSSVDPTQYGPSSDWIAGYVTVTNTLSNGSKASKKIWVGDTSYQNMYNKAPAGANVAYTAFVKQ